MKPSLRAKLDSLTVRLEELNRRLSAEDATRDLDAFRRLSREHAELTGKVELYGRYRKAERDAEDARDMAADAVTRICSANVSLALLAAERSDGGLVAGN